MEEITQALATITDWFVKEGAEVIYGPGRYLEDDGIVPELHEARLDGLQIFIGEPIDRTYREAVAEVAVLLRTGIPLPVDVVEESVEEFANNVAVGFQVDVIEDPDDGSCAIWVATTFWNYAMEDGSFDKRLRELLALAQTPEATAIREQTD